MGAQLRIVRRRIRSVQSTKKITRAMELIASSRIVKAQQRVESSRPYAVQLTKAMEDLARQTGSVQHPLLEDRESPSKAGILVVTSDRGLAGAYNANVLKIAERLFRDVRDRGLEPVLYVVGKKGDRLLPLPRRADAQELARVQRGAALRGGRADRPHPHQGLRGRGDRRAPRRLHRLPLRVHAPRDREAIPADRARGGRRARDSASSTPSTCSSRSPNRSSTTSSRSTW